MEQFQSHIWLTASSYIGKYLRISSYIRKPFLIYDIATAPFWISLYMRKIWFSFFIGVSRLPFPSRPSMTVSKRSVLWIRIQHFQWIWIRSGFGSGSMDFMTKNWEKYSRKKYLFFGSKIAIYLSHLGLLKGRPSYRRYLQPTTENIQHFKKLNLLNFYLFCGSFSPSWIRIRIANSIRVRILRIRSGSGDPIVSRSSPDPNPLHWKRYMTGKFCKFSAGTFVELTCGSQLF